jgi:rfaE bifunctional protein kinase chain/domain
VNLRHRLGSDIPVGLVDQRIDAVECAADLADDLFAAQAGAHLGQLPGEIIDEQRLVEEFGARGGIFGVDDGGEGLRAAQPPPETDQLGQLLVVEFGHRLVDVLQGPVELAAHLVPFPPVGFLDDAVAARHDRFAHIDGLRECEDIAADILDPLAVLGLHGDEAVGDHRAEQERVLCAIGRRRVSPDRPELGAPIRVTELFQDHEDLARDGDDHLVDRLRREFPEVDLLGGRGRFGGCALRGQHGAGQRAECFGLQDTGNFTWGGAEIKHKKPTVQQVPSAARVQEIIDGMPARRVLVAGDLMLDEFIWGKVSRISPEAPVPVVAVDRETSYPGGAANVARNLREFTPHAAVLGLAARDAAGQRLRDLLAAGGIDTAGVVDRGRGPTTVKTRIIARTQQVVRVDRELNESPGPAERRTLLAALEAALPAVDAVIIEDYGKGLLDRDLAGEITAQARGAGKPVAVDPNPNNPIPWHGVTVIKPNRHEAFAAAGLPWSEPAAHPLEDQQLLKVGEILLEKWGTDQLLVTLSELGMMLFTSDGQRHHTPTRAREVYDVSGAGDTAIALYTLALCAGATPVEASEIANHASGVVVGKLGTATLTPPELFDSFKNHAG